MKDATLCGFVFLPTIAAGIASAVINNDKLLNWNWMFLNDVDDLPREVFSTITNFSYLFAAITVLFLKTNFTICKTIASFSIIMMGSSSFSFHFYGAARFNVYHFNDLLFLRTSAIINATLASCLFVAEIFQDHLLKKNIIFSMIDKITAIIVFSIFFFAYFRVENYNNFYVSFFGTGTLVVITILLLAKRNFHLLRSTKNPPRPRFSTIARTVLLTAVMFGPLLIFIGVGSEVQSMAEKAKFAANLWENGKVEECATDGYQRWRYGKLIPCCEGLFEHKEHWFVKDDESKCTKQQIEEESGCMRTRWICRQKNYTQFEHVVERPLDMHKLYKYDIFHGFWHSFSSAFLSLLFKYFFEQQAIHPPPTSNKEFLLVLFERFIECAKAGVLSIVILSIPYEKLSYRGALACTVSATFVTMIVHPVSIYAMSFYNKKRKKDEITEVESDLETSC